MKKESAHIVYSQYFHGEAESEHNYKEDNAYRNAQRKIRTRHIFKHLNHLEKPKMNSEKMVRLEKFCRFVVPEVKDHWMYQHPL